MIKEFLPTNLNLISVNAVGFLSGAVLLLFAVVSGIVIFHLLRVERKSNALAPVKIFLRFIVDPSWCLPGDDSPGSVFSDPYCLANSITAWRGKAPGSPPKCAWLPTPVSRCNSPWQYTGVQVENELKRFSLRKPDGLQTVKKGGSRISK